jgi:hypothetical protein
MHSALGFMSPTEFEEKMTKKGDTENAAIAA